MDSKKAFLLLNGLEPSSIPDLEIYDIVCAIDGAYNFLSSKNIKPDLVTGDFDSINSIPPHIETIATPDQNYTDFDKALSILQQRGYHAIDVYGASGNEHDHFLGNLSTALQWKNELSISFFDDFGTYFFIEKVIKLEGVKNKTISLVPFPKASGIITEGLLYPVKDETFTFGQRIGTRNKAKNNEVHIRFKDGELLIFISNT